MQNFKLVLLFFENFPVDFLDFLFFEKKNYQAQLLCVFYYLHINLNILSNFMTLYWATDIIIPDYPLSIDM